MAYCSVDDVKRDFPSTDFDKNSARVKSVDIPDHIADADALINSYLSGRYATPILVPDALPVLKVYSRAIVADKIKGLLEIESSGSQGAYQQNVRTGLNTRDVLAILKDVRDGKIDIAGGSLNVSRPITGSFGTGGAPTTRFTKDEDQW